MTSLTESASLRRWKLRKAQHSCSRDHFPHTIECGAGIGEFQAPPFPAVGSQGFAVQLSNPIDALLEVSGLQSAGDGYWLGSGVSGHVIAPYRCTN
jgi:hypothetical protein